MSHELEQSINGSYNQLPFLVSAVAGLQSKPKIDLHRHLVGSIRPEVLVYIANKIGTTIPIFGNDIERIKRSSVFMAPLEGGYKSFLSKRIWGTFKHIFSSPRGVANAMYWAISDASHDGVCYVEFRVSPYGITPDFPLTLSVFIDSLKEGIDAAARDYPGTLAKIILSVGRSTVFEKWDLFERGSYYDRLVTIASKYRDVIVGFDISGDEEKYPNKLFVEFAEKVKGANFKLTVHAGETGNVRSVWEAIELLGADRIGHGIGAVKDPILVKKLAEQRLPLEICPTSNWFLGCVPSLEVHPIREFMDQGVLVTVNTDDPVMFGNTTLSEELHHLINAKCINEGDVESLQITAIETSFASNSEKANLLSQIQKVFSATHSFATAMS